MGLYEKNIQMMEELIKRVESEGIPYILEQDMEIVCLNPKVERGLNLEPGESKWDLYTLPAGTRVICADEFIDSDSDICEKFLPKWRPYAIYIRGKHNICIALPEPIETYIRNDLQRYYRSLPTDTYAVIQKSYTDKTTVGVPNPGVKYMPWKHSLPEMINQQLAHITLYQSIGEIQNVFDTNAEYIIHIYMDLEGIVHITDPKREYYHSEVKVKGIINCDKYYDTLGELMQVLQKHII